MTQTCLIVWRCYICNTKKSNVVLGQLQARVDPTGSPPNFSLNPVCTQQTSDWSNRQPPSPESDRSPHPQRQPDRKVGQQHWALPSAPASSFSSLGCIEMRERERKTWISSMLHRILSFSCQSGCVGCDSRSLTQTCYYRPVLECFILVVCLHSLATSRYVHSPHVLKHTGKSYISLAIQITDA